MSRRAVQGCVFVFVCVCVWACTDLSVTWECVCVFWNSTVRNCVCAFVPVFTLFCMCVCVCVHLCVCVYVRVSLCASVAVHAGALTYLCPPGMTLKICGSSSLLVSEQRLSALHCCPCGPPSPPLLLFPPFLPQLHPLPNTVPQQAYTHTRTHTPTTPSCVPTSTEDDLCSARVG